MTFDEKDKDNKTNHKEGSGQKKSRRGFASMDPQRRKEIASRGGKTAHQLGKAHRFTSDEARQAGVRGGKSVSQNRAHMAEIGKKGAQARKIKKNKTPS